jgi:hypothetical protein
MNISQLIFTSYSKIKTGLRTTLFMLVVLSILLSNIGVGATPVSAANIVGQGFVVTPSDLAFILRQIKIAERHSRALAGTDISIPANPDPVNDPYYCQSMIGLGEDQIASPLLAFGLRTVDGYCNNLQLNQADFGAVDQPFPRLATPEFRSAEDVLPGFGPAGQTSYEQTSGSVFDSEPRMISNLIVDQTASNPAAVAVAGNPVRDRTRPAAGLRAAIPDPAHPEHHHRCGTFATLQRTIHNLRPIFRSWD